MDNAKIIIDIEQLRPVIEDTVQIAVVPLLEQLIVAEELIREVARSPFAHQTKLMCVLWCQWTDAERKVDDDSAQTV